MQYQETISSHSEETGSKLYVVQSFADKDIEELFNLERNRRCNAISRVALRKLIQMNQARVPCNWAIPLGICINTR